MNTWTSTGHAHLSALAVFFRSDFGSVAMHTVLEILFKVMIFEMRRARNVMQPGMTT